jgi:hypothetical protein
MGADFRNGLLAISLEVIIPESQKPRKVAINSGVTYQSTPQLLNEENNNGEEQPSQL